MGIELIQPGDFICVSYLQPNLVEEGIAEFEAGKLKGIYVHAAGCIGGPEIVQAVARGVKYGSINDYLTPGYAKVLFCRVPMTPAQREGCVNYWKSQVGDSYNFQGDARLALLLVNIRKNWPLDFGDKTLKIGNDDTPKDTAKQSG